MQRDADYMLDMLQAARAALSFVSDQDVDGFASDLECQFAVVRAIEIIGEAAGRVSQDTRAAHPEVPWRDIIAMRNRVIHGYDDVDLAVVWDTVQDDLPSLIQMIEPLVPPEAAS